MPSATTNNSKSVNVIARVEFKSDARKVVYLVRSSDGATQYETCLFDGKATSCPCPATVPCYHMVQCERIEAARTTHMQEHGTIAGFVFALPMAEVVEEKARKPRKVYAFDTPASIEEMQSLVAIAATSRSKAELKALHKLLVAMCDGEGKITVAGQQWYYDAGTRHIYEVVEVAPALSQECPQDVYRVAGAVEVPSPLPEEEEEFTEELAEVWTQAEIEAIRRIAKPVPVSAPASVFPVMAKIYATPAPITDISQRGALNGNRGFSLL